MTCDLLLNSAAAVVEGEFDVLVHASGHVRVRGEGLPRALYGVPARPTLCMPQQWLLGWWGGR